MIRDSMVELSESIVNRFENPGISTELKEWANEQIHDLQPELDLILQGDDGYEDFLLDEIQREVEKYQARDVDAVPYDALRERPLCTCDDLGCSLKRGQIPSAIRHADSLAIGIRRFKQSHTGDPMVLVDADERWRELRGEIGYVLRRVVTYLDEGADDLPEELRRNDLAEVPSAEATGD